MGDPPTRTNSPAAALRGTTSVKAAFGRRRLKGHLSSGPITMGKVHVAARIENVGDLFAADRGQFAHDQIQGIEVPDALVDTRATGLSIPRSMIERLGIDFRRNRIEILGTGPKGARVLGTARLTIEGRDWPVDVMELPDGCPVMIGQVPLHAMDFVIDERTHSLIGNPAHGGEQIIELY